MDDDEGSRLSSESEGNPSEGENDDAGPEMSEALRKRLAKVSSMFKGKKSFICVYFL